MIFGSNVGNMGNYEFLKEIQKCNTKDDIENFIDSKYLIVVDAGIFCDDEVNVNIRFNDKPMIDNLKDDISDLIFSLKNDKYYAETKIAVFDLKVTDEFKDNTRNEFIDFDNVISKFRTVLERDLKNNKEKEKEEKFEK